MQRIGLFASNERAEYLRPFLDNAYIDLRDARVVPLDTALAAWEAGSMDIIIIDDASCVDKYEEEEILIRWAQASVGGSARVVFIADTEREIDDPFFFQLVTTADVKDIIHLPIGHTIEETLPLRLSTPTKIQEVSYWRTTDKRKLTRTSDKKGILGALARRREEKARAKMLEEARASHTPNAECKKASAMPEEEQTGPLAAACPICGTALVEGQPFCGACGTRIAPEITTLGQPPESAEEIIAADVSALDETLPPQTDTSENTTPATPIQTPANTIEQKGTAMTDFATEAFNVEEALLEKPQDSIVVESEPELRSPSAKHIVAVGASRHGIGSTHLTFALALELAGKGCKTAVAIPNLETYAEARAMLAPNCNDYEKFSYGYIDVFPYFGQRKHADEYSAVVVDCGLIDYPDTDINSPALLFERANHKVMLCSGAPWDIVGTIELIRRLGKTTLADIHWYSYSAPKTISEVFGRSIAECLATDKEIEVNYVPYRPTLFAGGRSFYDSYKDVLDPICKTITSIEPEQAASMRKA